MTTRIDVVKDKIIDLHCFVEGNCGSSVPFPDDDVMSYLLCMTDRLPDNFDIDHCHYLILTWKVCNDKLRVYIDDYNRFDVEILYSNTFVVGEQGVNEKELVVIINNFLRENRANYCLEFQKQINSRLYEINMIVDDWEVYYSEDEVRYICKNVHYVPQMSHDGTYHNFVLTWEYKNFVLKAILELIDKDVLFSVYVAEYVETKKLTSYVPVVDFEKQKKETVVKIANELYNHNDKESLICALNKIVENNQEIN